MNLTQHAHIRSQQRSIPPLIVNWLLNFGEEKFDNHGGVVHFFSKRSRRKLEQEVGKGPVRKLSEYLDTYLIKSSGDGAIITVGHRITRMKL